jgi:TPR repeat protein
MEIGKVSISILPLALSLWAAGATLADDAADGEAAYRKGDYQTAVKLLMPLAQQGNYLAELWVGVMYLSGHGLPQDKVQAAKWFRASAEQGNLGAQTDIGIMYATGSGVPRDLLQAYMWFSLAAAQDPTKGAAEYRDHVASEMAQDQIQQAQAMAEKCRAANYKGCDSP